MLLTSLFLAGVFRAPAALGLPLLPLCLLAAESAAPAPALPFLGSRVFDWSDLPAKVTAFGVEREVARHATATLSVLECRIATLNPGADVPPAAPSSRDSLLIVREGRIEVTLDGRPHVAGPGSVFYFEPGDARSVRNSGHRRAVFWLVELAGPALPGDPSPSRRSAFFDWEKLPVVATGTGSSRAVFRSPAATLRELSVDAATVAAGEAAHAAHRHADEELVLVRDGTLEATVGGVAHRAPAGSVLFFASGDLHGLRNAGDTAVTYFVLRFVTAATPAALP